MPGATVSPADGLASSQRMATALRRLLTVGFSSALALGIALPYQALYLANHFRMGPAAIGSISLLAGFLSLPAQLVGGHLSDRLGRRYLVVIGTSLSALGCACLEVLTNQMFAIVGFLMLSLGFATVFALVQAVAGDIKGTQRDKTFAWVAAAIGAGWGLGPAIGGVLVTWSYRVTFGTALLVSCAAIIFSLRLPETASSLERAASRNVRARPAWKDRRFMVLSVLVLVAWLVGGQLVVTLPLWIVGILKYPPWIMGFVFAVNGLLIAGGQITLTRVVSKLRRSHILALGAVGFGTGYGTIGIALMPALLIGAVLFTLGEMLLVPTTSGALDRLAPPGRRGQYQGSGVLFQTLGWSAGPLLGGLLLQYAGGQVLWATCLVTGLCCAVGFLLYGRWENGSDIPVSDPTSKT